MGLLAEIEAYLVASGMSATAFGAAAMGDGKFVWRLRKDPVGITVRTVERVLGWMRDNPVARVA